jgi:putative Mg2+ transporter-C (MgtC) family protein
MDLTELMLLGRVVPAVILSAILGWQRQRLGKWAGIRTYALVGGGSALFTVLSMTAFSSDPARVVSNIVTGIGFLGAGTILHKVDRVEGLTTAAGLWMVAAIGMAVGVEYYVLAAAVSLLALLIFVVDDKKIGANKNGVKNEDD